MSRECSTPKGIGKGEGESGGKGGKKGGGKGRGNGMGKGEDRTCHHCGVVGHGMANCFTLHPQKRKMGRRRSRV